MGADGAHYCSSILLLCRPGIRVKTWHKIVRRRRHGVPFLEEAQVGLGQQAEVGVELLYGRAVAAVDRRRACRGPRLGGGRHGKQWGMLSSTTAALALALGGATTCFPNPCMGACAAPAFLAQGR